MKVFVSIVVLLFFAAASVAGLPLLLMSPDHHHDCPLRISADSCDSSIIDHLSLWELMVASVLLLMPLFYGVFASFRIQVPHAAAAQKVLRMFSKQCHDPTLLQLLFKRGILNRKEPHGGVSSLSEFINFLWNQHNQQYLRACLRSA